MYLLDYKLCFNTERCLVGKLEYGHDGSGYGIIVNKYLMTMNRSGYGPDEDWY